MSQSQRVVFEDLRTGQLRNKEETYLRLITGYGITRYTREQLGCQDCLNDLNQEGKDNCEEVSKSTRRSTMPTTSMTQRMEERKIEYKRSGCHCKQKENRAGNAAEANLVYKRPSHHTKKEKSCII
ncbi:uncharacterized protein ACN427_000365 isoform 3-T3 [Glossina fuscipes fuscipes]